MFKQGPGLGGGGKQPIDGAVYEHNPAANKDVSNAATPPTTATKAAAGAAGGKVASSPGRPLPLPLPACKGTLQTIRVSWNPISQQTR